MPNLNDICRDLTEEVDHALAAAVVDRQTGLLLGVSHNVSYFTQSYLDTVAAAAVEMFSEAISACWGQAVRPNPAMAVITNAAIRLRYFMISP